MARKAIANALKAIPAGQGRFSVPNAAGMGRISPALWEAYAQNSYMQAYGPFLPRPPELFSDGAFAPAPPIIPTPVDQPPPGGVYAGPRWWPYRQAWNLPTPPGTEGLKLACYADTEILTRDGWKLFPDLGDDDEVATRNPQTKAFEWQKPAARHSYEYDGELIRFTSRGVDLLVTPNHRVLHTSGHGKNCSELIKRADECELLRSGAMIATSIWDQPDLAWFDVPAPDEHGIFEADIACLKAARHAAGITKTQLAEKLGITVSAISRMEQGTGRFHVATRSRVKAACDILHLPVHEIIKPDPLTRIAGDDFAAFMGAYISEGCVSASTSGNLRIFLSQDRKSKGFQPYRDLLIRILGREPYYDGHSWTFNHDGLARYLLQCGESAPRKCLPVDVLSLSARQLRIFLDFYGLGDGWKTGNSEAFTTTSSVLAGQLQEVAQKTGLSATVKRRDPRESMLRGHRVRGTCPRYDIFLRTTRYPKWTSCERVDYSGRVYCVTVPNGIIYVRRNGKAVWSGNSFDQLRTLSQKYSVARAAIELRIEEIRGLEWHVKLTTNAAKAYRDDLGKQKELGEKVGRFTRFFSRPDPDFWNFDSFLAALLEEIFVYDALSLIFRPKFGTAFGMSGRGLLGSDLDSLNLVSGPCYSDDTEVLTRRGWLKFADTLPGDEFATRNPKTRALEWQQPTYFHKEAWTQDLINFCGRGVDILVTPNHRMLVTAKPRGVTAECHGDEWIIPAGILASKGNPASQLIPLTSENNSPDLTSFRFPRKPGRPGRKPPFEEMSGDDFAAFMGMWLAEGCVTWHGERGKSSRPTIFVTQARKSRGYHPYKELLDRLLGRKVSYNEHSFYFRHAELAEYLRRFGRAHEKFIPEEILGEMSARQCEIFWHYYWLGDGFADRQRICTSSSRMADDLQVLAQRMGKWASVCQAKNPAVIQLPGGRSISGENARPKYLVALQSFAASQWNTRSVEYDGSVYCVSLPNETMYVRRNGKPAWCCNTIRPLIDLHGGRPRPPAPAFQQFLYGVPRSDYMTIAMGTDIDDSGLSGAEVNKWDADIMLYAPYWATRETPYGFPPVERALLPIISGLQKQEFQLDYFTEGSVPAVYISPGDNSISPTQIAELQSALNALAGDKAYHMKVVVLPPGSKVEPQRPVDLSDGFDLLVQTQVCMAFDVTPIELGILPNIGTGPGTGAAAGGTASGVRMGAQESRDIKSRKSAKPMLRFLCDIFNYVIQDICKEPDLEFEFEGLVNDDDKAQIIQWGVEKVQNGLASVDEVRDELDLPPWGLPETSGPVVFTAQGPVPFELAPKLIEAAITGAVPPGQGTNSGQNPRSRTKQPSVRRGGQTQPNGSHPAPLAPHREAPTGAHAAAAGAVQQATPRTGGTTARSSVAGSRKKAIDAEFSSLKRHLRKGTPISEWEPYNIPESALSLIAEDMAKGVLIDTAVARAQAVTARICQEEPVLFEAALKAEQQWPGWRKDLSLTGQYAVQISQAFQDAEIQGRELRQKAASGGMYVSAPVLRGLISDNIRGIFAKTMTPLWEKAWDLGYDSARQLLGSTSVVSNPEAVQNFIDTEGAHWIEQVARTGTGNSNARSDIIARTEVARAVNAAAIQCYRDHGVQYKHLLVSPDDTCDECMAAKEEGDIPLDAIFPGGGLGGPFHPQCRCVPAPAGIDLEPPMAHVGKGKAREDPSRLGWLLLRAEDEDGKCRFLLQQRDDGSWGMPGGTLHAGEDGWTGAVRETTEEIGDLPELKCAGEFHHMEDGKQVYLYLCDVPYFAPKLNGSTPEETQGAAWFRKGEIKDLDLTPKFREDWEGILKGNVSKSIRATENGEMLLPEDARRAAGMGSRWPYPMRADGSPLLDRPVPENNRDGGGQAGGEMGAIEPPFIVNDLSDRTQANLYPHGDETAHPRRRDRNRPAKKIPHGPDGRWPEEGEQLPDPGPAGQGVPGGPVRKSKPVTGSVPAKAPQPVNPQSTPAQSPDPGEPQQLDEDENILPGRGHG